LRDIVANLDAQAPRLYHLGVRRVARSSLARVNQRQPFELYESLFGMLYGRCRRGARGHKFRFKNKLYSLDSSLIDLSLKIFPWADFNRGKAAMKLHIGLDHGGYLPAFAAITASKTSDIAVARAMRFGPGSIVVCDKGYTDFAWYKALTDKGIFFVTRTRDNLRFEVLKEHDTPPHEALRFDQTVRMTGDKPGRIGLAPLRRVGWRDAASGKHYVFLTNAFDLSAPTIAALYKERWQIELFFKWIKQNLKIKAFVGNSKNAVMTQIWIALCTYLLLAYLKFIAGLDHSLQQIVRLLALNLFLRRDMLALLTGRPPGSQDRAENTQLCLL
jgi:putative transposase